MPLVNNFTYALQKAQNGVKSVGLCFRPTAILQDIDPAPRERVPDAVDVGSRQSMRSPIDDPQLTSTLDQKKVNTATTQQSGQLSLLRHAVIDLAQADLLKKVQGSSARSLDTLTLKIAELKRWLTSAQASPFSSQINSQSFRRIIEDLEPQGALIREIEKNFSGASPQQQVFLHHLSEYIDRLLVASETESTEVQTALNLFPPEDRVYHCAGGTVNRLLTARQCLDAGPRALLKSLFQNTVQAVLLKADEGFPSGYEIHGNLAVHALFGANPSVLNQMDIYFRSPIPYLKAEALWQAYSELQNIPAALQDSVQNTSKSIGDLNAVSLQEQALFFTPWCLRAWTNDGDSYYVSRKDLEAAYLDKCMEALQLRDAGSFSWSELAQINQPDLPNFQTLINPEGHQWLVSQLSPEQPQALHYREALQAMALLSEAVADAHPHQVLQVLFDLGKGSIKGGLNLLKDHESLPLQHLIQRITDRVEHYQQSQFVLQPAADEDILSLYALIGGREITANPSILNFRAKDDEGNTLLHLLAGADCYRAIIEIFDNQRVLLEAVNLNWERPVHLAARNGHSKTLAALCRAGASVHQRDKTGATPLFIAAKRGHVQAIKVLIKAGAHKNRSDMDGQTPLFIAAKRGHVDAIKALTRAGAHKNHSDMHGQTPLFIAAKRGHVDAIEALIQAGARKSYSDLRGQTPLHVAAEKDHVGAIEALIKAGAKMDMQSRTGATPVYAAAYWGRTRATEALIKAGANMNKPSTMGATPVYAAAYKGHPRVIEALSQAGAKMNKRSRTGATPVYAAALGGHSDAIEALGKAGANVNLPNKKGATPVYAAALSGHAEAIEALRKAGANVNIPDKKGITPLFAAEARGYVHVVEALK